MGVLSNPLELPLGDRTYVLVPQRIGYLQKHVGRALSGLTENDLNEGGDILGMLGTQAYSLLKVFIPDLMPEYEFQGYSKQAWARKQEIAQEAAKLSEEVQKPQQPEQIETLLDQLRALEVEAGDLYDEQDDKSPTGDQIVNAFQQAMHINRFDLFKHLGKLVGTKFLQVSIQKVIADFLQDTSPTRLEPPTASLPTTSGAPESTSQSETISETDDTLGLAQMTSA